MNRFLFSALLLAPSFAFAGPEFGPGNGGDVVRCSQASENRFSGIYTLDYLLTFNAFNNNSDIVDVANWDQSADRVLRFIGRFAPHMRTSFDNYLATLDNHTDYAQSRIWVGVPSSGLVNIRDESTVRLIPRNCTKDPQQVEAIQAVVRVPSKSIIRYEADVNILNELQKRPLQQSFLLVHEWLRDFTQDAEKIRQMNRFIHSDAWEVKTPIEILQSLSALGFTEKNSALKEFSKGIYFTYKAIENKSIADLRQAIAQGYLKIRTNEIIWQPSGFEGSYDNGQLFDFSGMWPWNAGYNVVGPTEQILIARYTLSSAYSPLAAAILFDFDEAFDLLSAQMSAREKSQDIRAVVAALARGRTELAQKLIAQGYPNVLLNGRTASVGSHNLIEASLTQLNSPEIFESVCAFPGMECEKVNIFKWALLYGADKVLAKYPSAVDLNQHLGEFKVRMGEEYFWPRYALVTCSGYDCFLTSGDPIPDSFKEYTLQTSNYYTFFIRTLNVKALTTIKNAGLLKPNATVIVDVKGKGKKQITYRQYVGLIVAYQKTQQSDKEYVRRLNALLALYK